MKPGLKMRTRIKTLLGDIPLTAEWYWKLRQRGQTSGRYAFRELQQALPAWRTQAMYYQRKNHPSQGKKILIFSTLRYWIEHAALLGLTLSALEHDVTLAFLPYTNWKTRVPRFDLRRQNASIRDTLKKAEPLLKIVSWVDAPQKFTELPPQLMAQIENGAVRDTQYTVQVEEVDLQSDLYQLRLERNIHAARAALDWLVKNEPDVVILPSGSILEFGAVNNTARSLNLPVISYEFGEQRQRIWLAKNTPVMDQNTDEMWKAYSQKTLDPCQMEQIKDLYASRQKASLWQNFARCWQGTPSEGCERVRVALNLDNRPVILLAANVIGDSLTLGRQVFTNSMSEWLGRTVREFSQMPQVQLVVRIHPGERYASGPSVAEIVNNVLEEGKRPAENIHLVAADAPINTYDLIGVADLGLVYTTTVGLEMALSGVPAIVIGRTHYRQRGFTLDPNSWEEYTEILNQHLQDRSLNHLQDTQVNLAWNYAYHFFFDYPLPFPWHLWHFWKDVQDWPVKRVLCDEGLEQFSDTFSYLVGESRSWR